MRAGVWLVILLLAWLLIGAASSPALAEAAAQNGMLTQQVQAQACGSTYTVVFGDYMSLIAQRCGISLDMLVAANPQIANPWWIYPGQVLNIPSDILIPPTGGDPPPAGSTSYTVRAGDTLFRIALAYGTSVPVLQSANTWITNPDLIYPGQVITIPPGGVIPPTGGNPPPTGSRTYTVVAGDRLYAIAQRYGTTTAAILAANPWMTNPDHIVVGWTIVIP